jgi:hypothetical protein
MSNQPIAVHIWKLWFGITMEWSYYLESFNNHHTVLTQLARRRGGTATLFTNLSTAKPTPFQIELNLT